MIRGGVVTLRVRDLDRAVRFYVETLGMKLVDEPAPGRAVIDAGEGFHLGLLQSDASAAAPVAAVGLYPKVPLAEAVAIFENRGVAFDVQSDGAFTVAHFRDVDGNALQLIAPAI
jgi:catechol 2,3-dioxygenase-like lactoylglutathione lyase family enzyme